MSKIAKLLRRIRRERFSLHGLCGETNVHLGCGNVSLTGFVNVDLYNPTHADVLADLNHDLPFASGSVDLVYSDNVFEHIDLLPQLVRECHRILKLGGFLVVRVPYFKSNYAFVDPTHAHFFTVQSMDYYVKGRRFQSEYRFFEEMFTKMEVYFDPENNSLIKRCIEAAALSRPDWFENSIISNLFVLRNIIFVLKK